MSITVRYFASLKERLGHAEAHLEISAPISVHDAWHSLNPQIALPANILAAINQEYVELDTLLKEDDELAFFPPVTGG